MADIIVDGKTRIFAIPFTGQDREALKALSATAINAGTVLHWHVTPTGLEGFEPSQAEIDNTPIGASTDSKLPGRISFSGTGLVLKKQQKGDEDEPFDLLSQQNTELVIVILDGVDAEEDVVATDEYEAYVVRLGDYNYVGRGEANSILRYRVAATPQFRVRGKAV